MADKEFKKVNTDISDNSDRVTRASESLFLLKNISPEDNDNVGEIPRETLRNVYGNDFKISKKLNNIEIVSFIHSNICLCILIIFLILSTYSLEYFCIRPDFSFLRPKLLVFIILLLSILKASVILFVKSIKCVLYSYSY